MLSVVLPIYNERELVAPLWSALKSSLDALKVDWEAVFVDDDSTDGTPEELLALSRQDSRIRFIRRIGRRGLSSAVVEGMLSTNAPYVAVIDCDLQHDETKLPEMLEILRGRQADLVVGSRYMAQGGVGDWSASRVRVSQTATRLAQWILPVPLSDPMSGFFMATRELVERSVRNLSRQGYKILVDIVMSSPTPPRVAEVPYTFRQRLHGESKLDSAVVIEYLMLLMDKTIGHIVPARFVLFSAVGASGVVVHMAALMLAMAASLPFVAAQGAATGIAMTFNFFVNNLFTYRDKRLRGFGPVLKGLLSFYLVCAIGAVSNVGVAAVLFSKDYAWWLSALTGILVGVVWNYALTSTFTWRK
jgi:dolichol-phosphate mannosyltransferase